MLFIKTILGTRKKNTSLKLACQINELYCWQLSKVRSYTAFYKSFGHKPPLHIKNQRKSYTSSNNSMLRTKKNPTPDILRYHCIRRPIGAFYDTLFRATSTRPQNLLPHNLPPTTNTSTTQLLLTYQMTHLTAKILKPNTTFVISSLN